MIPRFITRLLSYFRPAGLNFSSGLAGALGGAVGLYNANRLPRANYYTPAYGQQMDQQVLAAMQQIVALNARNLALTDPQMLASYQAMSGIDLTALSGAGQQAGQQYGAMADTAGSYGGMMRASAEGALGNESELRQAGAQTYATGLDPQNQLRDRMRQRVVEGSRAADSARGIGMSPYSAGLENQATSNFEMDWQNQQLARQLAGLQGYGQASSAANQTGAQSGAGLGASMNYYGMQPGLTMGAAQTPIQAQMMQYRLPMEFSSMFQQAQNQNALGPQYSLWQPAASYTGGAAQSGAGQFQNQLNRDLARNAMMQQSVYGLAGGGQSRGSNPYGSWGGNESGFGDPMEWLLGSGSGTQDRGAY